MAYRTTRGNTTKVKIAQLLEFLRKNKNNKYCSHEIAKIYGIPNSDASTNLSILYHWNYVCVVSKDRCAECRMKHSFYQYKKGDRDAVFGRRFKTRTKYKAKSKTRKYERQHVPVKSQTEKIITIPVTIKVRVNLE